MKFKILYNCKWMFWAQGMVVWPFVFFKQDYASDRLYRHELEHCYQFNRLGRFKFITTYLWYQLRHGYRDNPYELEAWQAENQSLTPQEIAWRENGVVKLSGN